MRLFHRLDDRVQFFFLGLIYRILMIHTGNRSVCRDRNDVHSIDVAELLLLGQRRTGHTGFFFKFVEEVLERDRGKRLALPLHLHMLLRLDCLMQAVGITASRHDTSGELVDDQHLVVLHHVILIAEHQVVRTQRQDDIMLDLQIFRICEVLDLEKALYLRNALRREVYDLVLLIDDKVSRLLALNSHDGVHLGQLFHILAARKLSCQNIARLVQLCGLAALTGNDKRRSRLVDQHRVHLVDDGVVQIPEHKLLLVDHHIVTQVVKTKLIVRHVGDVAVVRLPALLRLHIVQDNANLESQELMYLSHPLRITLSQIVIDRDNMHALALQCVQIRREQTGLRLTFTGSHLGDPSLMQDDTTDQLYPVMLCIQNPARRLTHYRVGFHQKVVQRLSICQSFLKFLCLISELLITQLDHLRTERFDLVDQPLDPLDLSFAVCSKHFLYYTHSSASFPHAAITRTTYQITHQAVF